jgi:alcohol dehydrogenase class IV
MRYDLDEIPELSADIGAALGVVAGGRGPSELAAAAADKMQAFAQSVGLTQRLRDFNLTDEQLRAILLKTDSWLMYILQISMGNFHK